MLWIMMLVPYVAFNYYFANKVYNYNVKFYTPKNIEGKVDMHENYPEFNKKDSISWARIFIGLNLFFWFKAITVTLFTTIFIISLKFAGNEESNDLKKRKFVLLMSKIWVTLVLISAGVYVKRKRPNCEELYKRYFGPDCKIDYEEDYSSLISNHTSWLDTIVYIWISSCGFIAKAEVQTYPILGIGANALGCLFVNRADNHNRHVILEKIEERQQHFLEKKTLTPLIIFPEGTVTNGSQILKFKKGAFHSLLPIKPYVILMNNSTFSLATGVLSLSQHFIRSMCYFYHTLTVLEIPVIKPTQFMYDNYPDKTITEKWEIYAEVARDIMCQVGEMGKSDKTLLESNYYHDEVVRKKKKE